MSSERAFVGGSGAAGSAPPARDGAAGRAWVWPAIVVGMLAAHAALCAITIVAATSDPSWAVEPDYYQKALNWDEHAAAMRAGAALGWTVEIDVASMASVRGSRAVRCRLSDRDAKPVDGATLRATVFHHARGADRTTLAFAPAGRGEYEASAALRKAGTWEFRIEAERGEERYRALQLVQVAPATGVAP
ncbi:MAG: FixH family protein [Phycisphaerae bacterium]